MAGPLAAAVPCDPGGPDVTGWTELVVPAGEARAVWLPAGSRLRIVDVEGGQVGDLFVFCADDLGEWLSVEHTRPAVGRLMPGPGESFFTNRRRMIAEIESDTSPGRHDTLYAACDPERYALLGVPGPHRSCAQNLREAMAGLGYDAVAVPQPVNLFMDVLVAPDGALTPRPASSRPGDAVTLRVLRDAVAVVSSCPMDVVAINSGGVTPLLLALHPPPLPLMRRS